MYVKCTCTVHVIGICSLPVFPHLNMYNVTIERKLLTERMVPDTGDVELNVDVLVDDVNEAAENAVLLVVRLM